MNATLIDVLPLWLLYLIVAAIVLLSIELGWRLGNRRRRRHAEEEKAPINAPVGATLALLAFLLAFTFGLAATRFDRRKEIVLQEANAIGTTYLRVDFLADSLRDEARNALREYLTLRAGGATAIMSPEGMAKAAALHDRLWSIATRAETTSNTVATGLFVQSLNELIDLDTIRVTGNLNRLPDGIWLMLCIVTIFSMMALGYEFGLSGIRSWTVTILMTIAFTIVITLIADLDRSQTGLLQVSQQPLTDLLNKIGKPTP
jgi:hypothetical protein